VLEYGLAAFGEDDDLIGDPPPRGRNVEPFDRLIDGFGAEWESGVVDRYEAGGAEDRMGLQGLLWVDVDGATAGGTVGADGEEREFGSEAGGDVPEAIEERRIAGVVDPAACGLDEEATEATMGIVEEARAPVAGRGEGDPTIAEGKALPCIELDDGAKAEAPDDGADTCCGDDGLGARDLAEGRQIQVIVVGVGDEHEIDLWQLVEVEPWLAEPFYGPMPQRPIGIDQYREACDLDQAGGVADPGDPDAIGRGWVVWRRERLAFAGEKDVGEEDLTEEMEVPFLPSRLGEESDLVGGHG